ncbi:MAG TPA: hypothetical protein VMU50_17480 [Polyangia bacterium]|nr:hypothetical protein [Polyangia bacterium]
MTALLALRQKTEEAAARALERARTEAAGARQAQARLESEAAEARAAWERARVAAGAGGAGEPEAGAETVARHRFAGKLAETARNRTERAARHRALALAGALRSEEEARQAYLGVRREREALERLLDRQRSAERAAIARRQDET